MNWIKGILLIMLGASCFGLIPFFAKTALLEGLNTYAFCLFRSGFASIEILLILYIKKINYKIKKEQIWNLLKASCFGLALTMITLTTSYYYIPSGIATTLHFIYPVAVMIGAIIFFKEKIRLGKIMALVISIIGVYFLVGFKSVDSINPTGIFFALVSGLFYAYYILVIGFSNINKLNSFVLAFYISFFSMFFLLAGSIFTGNFTLDVSLTGLKSTAMVALVANLIGMVAFQSGLKVIGATTASILCTFEPIVSLIIGVLVFHEKIFWHDIIGIVLVLFSIVIIALAEKKLKKKNHDLPYNT